jgi:broad specificity phosphatase PhoE
MKPLHIHLIRHGQSEANANHALYATIPDYKIQLTPLGRNQAFEAGKNFRETVHPRILGCKMPWRLVAPIAIYLSPFTRTRQTCDEFLQGLALPPRSLYCKYENQEIREQEYGHFRTLNEAARIEKERNAYGTFYYRIPDGESGADVYSRCALFLETLYRDFQKPDYPKRVIIFTHGLTLRLLIMRWLHLTHEQFEDMKNPENTEMTTLRLNKSGKYELTKPFPKYQPKPV